VSQYREGDSHRRHSAADLRSGLANEEEPKVSFAEGAHPIVHLHAQLVLLKMSRERKTSLKFLMA
jgi:hypothetical protein